MQLVHHRPGPELTHERRVEARMRRLSAISFVALGAITWLAIRDDAPISIVLPLTAGWFLMPTLLRAGLREPRVRYALVVPATLVAVALTAFSAVALGDGASAGGWWTITASIWFGALLGMWFWFRWLPVPAALDDPFSAGRVALVALHVAAALTGIAMVI